ncbi:protein LNK3-like isoform X2 [Durio zibethinus]|uniref:Protein LNK3-like isoform X2 n=1 Tax=Durio zibethinus TaxID=66656 RepID=A0A6P5YXD3_DURZI|nr:protein LNK3-like isoform X2 [Durio zibethinus]
MEWYFGDGTEDLVVPMGQQLVDGLPSPESWSEWGLTAPGHFESFNKCFITDANFTHEGLRFNGKLCNDAEIESSTNVKDPSCCSSICGGLSDESLNQTTFSRPQPDYQLDDFARFEQMDDIFLNSLLEDLPGSEDLHNLFGFSPEYRGRRMPADYLLTDASLTKIWVPPQEKSANGFISEEISLEESVLLELEMVMAQLSDKTRICFRDAFYRLAKNSKQNPVALNQHGNVRVGNHSPKWTISEEKMRSAKKGTTESETNTIDRTIANLTFNKMEINVRDFPAAPTPANSKPNVIKVTGQLNQSSSQSQIHCFPQSVTPSDAEVPFLGHEHSPPRMDGHGYASS